jgi:PAS domain S-box-containing protein
MQAPQQPDDDLERSQARLRALATTPSTLVWYTARDGTVDMENPSWEAFTGQSHDQYAGWGWLQAIHPDDREATAARWRQAVAARAPIELQYRLRRRDGEYRDISAQGAPLLEHGEVREWVGICFDLSETQRAAAALKASEERYRFLDRLGEATRALNDASLVMATSARLLGEHLGVTRCAYADVEADSDRFTIRSDWSVDGVPSSAGVYSLALFGPQAVSNLRRGEHLVVDDVDRDLGDDGGARMFNAIGIKAVICAGLVKADRLVALMAVHQSVPRHWTDDDIALVTEVVERCWAHIERVRDYAMLREQDQRKDEFLATLAHELRNPLAPIKYSLAMLRGGGDPARSARARDIIDRQVNLMARLIDDLLDLSRINRGLIQLRREPVSVGELMAQAAEATRPALDAGQHRLELQLPARPLFLDADPARIVQVIGNLLANAAKYTPNGGHIRLAARADAGRAVIEVEDDGIGIPPDQQGRLFQMFTQLPHSAARAQGGLGIGLSLVKTLVEIHGGSVRAFSRGLDEGSTFTVELPLVEAERAEPGAGDAASMPSGRLTRVLVVEDNEDGREALVTWLTSLGYHVEAAADGERALDVARSFVPEMVLLDLGLPGIDGFDVARSLRGDLGLVKARIVALTGWGTERDRARTKAAGFDDHLTKPVDPGLLQDYLARFSP